MNASTAELDAPVQDAVQRSDDQIANFPASANINRLSAVALASSALAACGGGGGGAGGTAGTSTGQLTAGSYTYTTAQSDQEAARFLLQAQFSASDAEIAAVRSQGYFAWLQSQVSKPYDPATSGFAWLDSKGYNVPDRNRNYFSSSAADYMVWNQLMASTDVPRRRMALALSEIFVVSTSVMTGYWPAYVMAAYWDVLCANAFGNYRTLLEDITLNLAMGNYLNTRGNKKSDGKGSAPDENYAREVMQLFTIGLVQLNMDGTPKLNGGATIDTYSNADITDLAKVFTGFDTDNSQSASTAPVTPQGGGVDNVPNTTFTRLRMAQYQNGRYRSAGTASFLGTTVNDVAQVATSLKTALDTLFNHPNNAPFISKQLIQRLVISNPSPSYVQRVATVYSNNGQGVRGDLGAVYAAILQDDEARAPAGLTGTEFGKLREPMVRLVQWARTFNVPTASTDWSKLGDFSDAGNSLGQSPLRSPSVFNFFRPGYVPPATALSAGSVAPEFQLVNESSVASYVNRLQGILDSGIGNPATMVAAYGAEMALATIPAALVNRVNLLLAAGQLSAPTVKIITDAVSAMDGTVNGNATQTDTNMRRRVCAAVLMVMASAEYLVQK